MPRACVSVSKHRTLYTKTKGSRASAPSALEAAATTLNNCNQSFLRAIVDQHERAAAERAKDREHQLALAERAGGGGGGDGMKALAALIQAGQEQTLGARACARAVALYAVVLRTRCACFAVHELCGVLKGFKRAHAEGKDEEDEEDAGGAGGGRPGLRPRRG